MSAGRPSLSSRIVQRMLIALYRWKGWRVEGQFPDLPKFVAVGAPHTSNWDFVFFIGATHELGVRPRFLGKHTLFRWPMTRFMMDMGGIPVDRSRRGSNYVEQVAQAFAAADQMALVIAPEGTRSSDGRWRTGFWHIARAAGVPIVPAWLDDAALAGGIGPPIWPTDDVAADLTKIAAFYRARMPNCPRFDRLAAGAHASTGFSPRGFTAGG